MDYYLSNHEEAEVPRAKQSNSNAKPPKSGSRPSSNYGGSSKKASDRKIMRLKFSLEEDEMLKDPMLMLEKHDTFNDSLDQLEHDLLKERQKGTNDRIKKM